MKAIFRRAGLVAGAVGLVGAMVALPAGANSGAAAAATSGSGRLATGAAAGNTAYWAEQYAQPPNWIFPFASVQFYSVANVNDFEQLMYRPLYWLDNGGKPGLDEARSLAQPPIVNGAQVIVNLKGWRWSDGETVDAQDVVFFLNMLRAERDNFAGYAPGELPDNLVSVSAASPTAESLTITFNRSYNYTWLLLNELSQITPMPAAWDISGLQPNGQPDPPGSGGCSALTWSTAVEAACQAVWTFMTDDNSTNTHPQEAGDLATYATNPLWQVVDGPWHLSSFSATTGAATMLPNGGYSGNDKPHFARFVEVPFTSSASELDALGRGTLTVGYVPLADTPPAPFPGGTGPNLPGLASTYNLGAQYSWVTNYFPINFDSRGDGGYAGAIFAQLYFRQALAMLVDQRGIISRYLHNYAVPGVGPVPTDPATSFLSETEINYPYDHNAAAAIKLLKEHGWKIVPDGTDVCAAAAGCGKGVGKGARLSFQLDYASANATLAKTVTAEAAGWSAAGIAVGLKALSFNDIIVIAASCFTGDSAACHSWEMVDWGGGWLYFPDFDPSGEFLFQSGSSYNYGNYSDPRDDTLIRASIDSQSNSWFYDWESYLAAQAPVVWQPDSATTLVEVAKGVSGVVVNDSLQTLTPEDWYTTAS